VTTFIWEVPGSNIGQDEFIVTKVLLPDPGVDGRIILGWTFRRWD